MSTSAPAPRHRPASAPISMLLAVLLVGLAVVGVHDLSTARGWSTGTGWLDSLSTSLDRLEASTLVVVVGVVVALLGLLLVVAALKPARRTHVETPLADGDVWISRRAVARLAQHAAERTPGVDAASVAVKRAAVKVRVTSVRPEVADDVRTQVEAALDGFTTKPVRISTKEPTDES